MVRKDLSSAAIPISGDEALRSKAISQFWQLLFQVLDQWFWKGRLSTCCGLHEVDYDVIKALKVWFVMMVRMLMALVAMIKLFMMVM